MERKANYYALPLDQMEFWSRDAEFLEVRVYEDGWIRWLRRPRYGTRRFMEAVNDFWDKVHEEFMTLRPKLTTTMIYIDINIPAGEPVKVGNNVYLHPEDYDKLRASIAVGEAIPWLERKARDSERQGRIPPMR